VQFLLTTGGAYHLTIDLERYERVERDIELKTGETARINIVLKEKRPGNTPVTEHLPAVHP
jgi:hypothetical protein